MYSLLPRNLSQALCSDIDVILLRNGVHDCAITHETCIDGSMLARCAIFPPAFISFQFLTLKQKD